MDAGAKHTLQPLSISRAFNQVPIRAEEPHSDEERESKIESVWHISLVVI